MSNLRPAPMFLRPSVVRQLINDTREIRKGMAQLQLLPVGLADQPKPSLLRDQAPAEEITRFETAHASASNDHDRPAVAQEVARPSEGSDALEAESAPFSSSADCGQHAGSNPVPANPDPVEAAPTGGDSEPAAEMSEPAAESEPVQSLFTCNGAALDWPDAPLPEHSDPDLDRPEPTPADDAGNIASEAAPVNGFTLMRSRATSAPAAVEARPVETFRNLGRRREPRVEAEPADSRAEVIRAVAKRLQARQDAKGVDWARVAAAHRAKAPTGNARPAPALPAPSWDECPRCGIPGWRGCDHFLPYEEKQPDPRFIDSRRGPPRMPTMKREGA